MITVTGAGGSATYSNTATVPLRGEGVDALKDPLLFRQCMNNDDYLKTILEALPGSSPWTFTAATTFSNTVTCNGTLTANGAVNLGNAAGTTGDAITVAGDLKTAPSGGRIAFAKYKCADADQTLNYMHWYIYDLVSTARTLIVTIADPADYTEFFVCNKGAVSTGTVTVYVNGDGPYPVAAGTTRMIYRYSGAWASTLI